MAIVMQMHWPETSKQEYEQVRREVRWEEDVPKGAKFHVAWFGDDGFHVIDLWDSAAEFDQFIQSRLMPVVKRVGVKGEPKVKIAEAHAIFAPNV